jgi:hypothetical protein
VVADGLAAAWERAREIPSCWLGVCTRLENERSGFWERIGCVLFVPQKIGIGTRDLLRSADARSTHCQPHEVESTRKLCKKMLADR